MIEWIAGLVAQVSAVVGAEASRYAASENGWAAIALVFDIAMKGLLIVAAAGLAAYLLRGASSAVRHFVWTLAAAALVALPVLALAMPRWQVAVPGIRRAVAPVPAMTVTVPEVVILREAHGADRRRVIVRPRSGAGSTVIVGGSDVIIEVPGVVIERAIPPLPAVPPMPPMPPTVHVHPLRPTPAPGAWSPSADAAGRAREQAKRAAAVARESVREATREIREASRKAAREAREAAREVREAAREAREAAVRARVRHHSESQHDGSEMTAFAMGAPMTPSSPSLASFPPPDPLRGGVPWTWLLVATWLAGVVMVLSRVVVGAVRVHMLGRQAWRIERGWPVPLVRRLCLELGIERPVRLLEGESTTMPLTWGVFRPVVLLPSTAAEWPAGRLETVLRHELAHVRRLDVLTQLIAEIACALHWFNPLVWLVAKRLRVEREMACDDDVLASGSPPSEYAADLVALARSLRPAAVSYAAIAMARPAHLTDRVHALLDEERRRGGVRVTHALAASAASLLVVAPLAAMVPVPGDRVDVVPSAAVAGVAGDGVEVPPAAVRMPGDGIEVAPVAEATVSIDQAITALSVAESAVPSIVIPPRAAVRAPAIAALSIGALRNGTPQQTICWGDSANTRRSSVSRNDESYSLEWEADDCAVEVRIRGEVRFNTDFTAVASISPGGSMRLVEEAGSTERRLDIGPGPEGLEYTWRVDGREAPFDAAANDWLSGMLLQLFRSAGYAANERSLWFLREHGVPGLLEEIDQLRSDHTRGVYYQAALEEGSLDASDAAQLIERATGQIRSDHELSRLLLAAGERFDFNNAMRDAFLAASRTLQSDHERGRVLAAVLGRGTLDAVTAATLLTSAAELRSDHEKAQLLTSLGAQYTLEPAIRSEYLRAAATIRSDHDKSRVLGALIAQQGSLGADQLAALLDVASTIRSDHEVSSLLVELASAELAEPALQSAFLHAAATINSDHDHRRVLTSLLNAGQLSPSVVSMVLRSALEIGSDHDVTELLLHVLQTQQLDAELRAEFLRALETIESDHNHGRVSSALLRVTEGG